MTKTKFHVCQSIAGLENLMKNGRTIEWLMIDDRPATVEELRKAIREAKARGYTVLPPCDNVTSTGHCAGHDIEDEKRKQKEE